MPVKTTGNADIDQATAEIALVLRGYSNWESEQAANDEAMRLRDAIMAGTREIVADEPTPEEAEQAHDVAVWERQWGKRNRNHQAEPPVMANCDPGYDRDMMGPVI